MDALDARNMIISNEVHRWVFDELGGYHVPTGWRWVAAPEPGTHTIFLHGQGVIFSACPATAGGYFLGSGRSGFYVTPESVDPLRAFVPGQLTTARYNNPELSSKILLVVRGFMKLRLIGVADSIDSFKRQKLDLSARDTYVDHTLICPTERITWLSRPELKKKPRVRKRMKNDQTR